MTARSRDERLAACFALVVEVHPTPLRVRESTPGHGGVRRSNAQALVDEGMCEWVDEDHIRVKPEPAGLTRR